MSRLAFVSLSFLAVSFLGCAAQATNDVPDDPAAPVQTEQHWDSQDGNPTHATHSYLTEFALDQLQGEFPELATYRAKVVDGANREIHDLPLSDPEQEALRIEDGGSNAACDHPEVVIAHARARYAAGDKAKAYWFAGIFLHYVEDLGVPAHALHVYHQSSPSNWDHFEVMATQYWYPTYAGLTRWDPSLSDPSQYPAFNAEWTRSDFQASFPGVTYTRTFYPMSWLWAGSRYKTFMRQRQGRTAMATKWALHSLVTHWVAN